MIISIVKEEAKLLNLENMNKAFKLAGYNSFTIIYSLWCSKVDGFTSIYF